MRYLAVADLHLGDGGLLEDFLVWGRRRRGPRAGAPRERARQRLGRHFAAWLARERTALAREQAAAHLLLLGDIVDLWQARRPREQPARALTRVFAAHPHVVTALRLWRGDGHALTWVLGNHDAELADPRAWEVACEVLPGLNASSGGAPLHEFHDAAHGLLALHGHQWDPLNRPRRRGPSPGELLVRHAVNPAEPHLPLVDKGRTTADTAALLGEWSGLGEVLHCWPRRLRSCWGRLASGRGTTTCRGARAARIKATVGDVAARSGVPVRFLLSGHEHRAAVQDIPEGGRHLELGTWRPVAHRDRRGRWRVEQQGHFARLCLGEGADRAEPGIA